MASTVAATARMPQPVRVRGHLPLGRLAFFWTHGHLHLTQLRAGEVCKCKSMHRAIFVAHTHMGGGSCRSLASMRYIYIYICIYIYIYIYICMPPAVHHSRAVLVAQSLARRVCTCWPPVCFACSFCIGSGSHCRSHGFGPQTSSRG